jgi:hypothetical protein
MTGVSPPRVGRVNIACIAPPAESNTSFRFYGFGGLELRVQGLGFMIWDLGLRFRVKGLKFRV